MTSSSRIAESTGLGSYFCEVQAEPLEMATTPLSASMTASESRPGRQRLTVLGRDRPGSPLIDGLKGSNAAITIARCRSQVVRRSAWSELLSSAAKPSLVLSCGKCRNLIREPDLLFG
jgi:hypothetical protein